MNTYVIKVTCVTEVIKSIQAETEEKAIELAKELTEETDSGEFKIREITDTIFI